MRSDIRPHIVLFRHTAQKPNMLVLILIIRFIYLYFSYAYQEYRRD